MSDPKYIVAIGASAGGLDALSSFFDHTPSDSVSYVIIPHLSPDFKSRMVEILSHHSKLEVVEAEEQMPVKENKVYLIPNTKYMGIKDGRLFLVDKSSQTVPHMTIDTFFTSLAADLGNRSIGIILSGAGTDGSKGAKAIQNAGGIILVQDPKEAKFNGMPKAAIHATFTNYVLSAKDMPRAIEQYVQGELKNETFSEEEDKPLDKMVLTQILTLIQDLFPFNFNDYKTPTLARRIKRRMVHNHFTHEQDYYAFLLTNSAEIELLINDILIGVTSFFRDPEAFAIIEQEVIPRIIDAKENGELLKLWIACCATGEEAYSMAILVKEYLEKSGKNLDVKIFATDINRAALDKATTGVFSADILKSVSKERIAKYFDRLEDHYKVKQEIRKMLIFARHDLTKNPPYCGVDLISCRNMLIYIKPVLQKQVLSKLSFGIKRNGFLVLGASENISIAKDDFVEIDAKWKIYQCTRVKPKTRPEGPLTAVINDMTLNQIDLSHALTPTEDQSAALNDFIDVVLQESGFSGVTIDENNQVTNSFGDLSTYLKQERFNFNLHELLPEPLAVAFNATAHKVRKLNERIQVNNISYTGFNTQQVSQVDLIITPFQQKKTRKKNMLVLFKPTVSQPLLSSEEAFNIDTYTKEYIVQLEEDLEQYKSHLQSSNEFLESSKEAMQSYNEELISANEEMQSANEELQSINEELETINSEHKSTIAELTELNDDLNNYFRSNRNGQLFVDNDILLTKYSPGTLQHINIWNGDIGRPLSNITTNIKFETLITDIKSVLANGETVLREVEDNNNRTYQVTTIPYLRQSDEKIHGAVINFYDITDLKRIQLELDKSNKMLHLATESAGMGLWSINLKTLELTVSEKLKDIFSLSALPHITYRHALDKIKSEHIERVIAAVKDTIENGVRFDIEFPVECNNDKTLCWVRAVGDLTTEKGSDVRYFTGLIQDITEHKLDELRKNDFIAIASHELKTPITSLQGYLELLAVKTEKNNDPFFINIVARARNQVKRMTTLIHSFLDVSRLESGKIHLETQTFNIGDLITEIITDIGETNPDHDIILHPTSPITVTADREKIGEVISNLLHNAVKYSPNARKIEVFSGESNGYFEFSVKDLGAGIKEKDINKLFDRFYRVVSAEDKPTIPGFGLGLYLCYEIIQRHKGKIWVKSDFSKGSTFYFTLPVTH